MDKYLKILVLVLSTLIYAISPIHSQSQEYKFRHLNTDHGLSSNEINVILKDSKGFIWIGTNDGLNRFDGYHIKTFHHDPLDSSSLKDDRIISIEEQIDGDLLIGTCTGGLNRYDYSKERFGHIPLRISDSCEINNIGIYLVKRNTGDVYWIGSDAGLGIYNNTNETFLNYLPDPTDSTNSSNRVHAVFRESQDRVWVGTDNGLFHFDPTNVSFNRIPLKPGWYYNKSFEKIIHCIYKDSEGIIWIGTHWFLYRYYNDSFEWIGPGGYYIDKSAPNSMAINAIAEQTVNGRQILWLATWGGLNRYDVQGKSFQYIFTEANNPEGLSSYAISSQYLDQSGLLWIGHSETGLDILNLQTNIFISPLIHEQASGLAALCFLVDSQGYLWTGMDDHGLLQLNHDLEFVAYYRFKFHGGEELQNCDIHNIFEDSSGNLWMGNSLLMEGLYIFNRDQGFF